MEFENWLEDKIYWTCQFIEVEHLYYLVKHSVEEGILEENFFPNIEELNDYMLKNKIKFIKYLGNHQYV